MKNILIILTVFFSVLSVFSQKVCLSEKKVLVDINAINKCAIRKEVVKTKKQKTKYIIASSTRYLKKRIYLNKVVHLASNLKTKALVDSQTTTKIDPQLLVKLKKEAEKQVVSFDSVENIPLFASCNEDSSDNIECFNNEMEKHIINNFVYPKEALKKGVEGNLEVSFVIDKNGEVKDVKIQGEKDNDVLKKEAMRIVLLLPKFTPGKEKGLLANVIYKFPMNFTLN
ncbi:energy transducer TonB [Tenacibaculum salmonis]|uniref:energy transducer TonB n=1 Tax=Tenacibaculum sp. P3-BQ1 TaxID=3232310 RepID=UPI0034E045F8